VTLRHYDIYSISHYAFNSENAPISEFLARSAAQQGIDCESYVSYQYGSVLLRTRSNVYFLHKPKSLPRTPQRVRGQKIWSPNKPHFFLAEGAATGAVTTGAVGAVGVVATGALGADGADATGALVGAAATTAANEYR
jgi:hypothetical protein